LERPVFQKYLFLADLKRWLLGRPEVCAALMSGSGSTLFAVLVAKRVEHEVEARKIREAWLQVA
jgi:4-diphosphocytidyl-2-C-methyl-D-erythritol kinase